MYHYVYIYSVCLTAIDTIYNVRMTDESWLTLSRNGGIIDGHGGRHTIVINCSTRKIDVHSTYLIVENVNNPSDIKSIMVSMDVVAKQNAHFSVMMDGKLTTSPVIDFGEVYYFQTYPPFFSQ